MTERIAMPPIAEDRTRRSLPIGAVNRLLDTLEKPLIVADRSGSLVLINTRARQCLEANGFKELDDPNLFADLLQVDATKIFGQVESGEHEVKVQVGAAEKKAPGRIQWMPETDWLVLEIENKTEAIAGPDPATQLTVQELLQEREITYRNLLAAYLKLQEVNRQKTVF